jgi:hypothetical protein
MLLDIKSLQQELSALADVKANLQVLSDGEGHLRGNAGAPLVLRLNAIAASMLDELTVAPSKARLRVVRPCAKSFEDDTIASLHEDVVAVLAIADNLAVLSNVEAVKRNALAPLVAQLSTILQTMEDALCALLPPEKACA